VDGWVKYFAHVSQVGVLTQMRRRWLIFCQSRPIGGGSTDNYSIEYITN